MRGTGESHDIRVRVAASGVALVPWLFAIVLLALVGYMWASDWITLQDERTVFTADCARGIWQGARCSGDLVAGPRYRVHALKAHGEVVLDHRRHAAGRQARTLRDRGRPQLDLRSGRRSGSNDHAADV